MTASWKNLFFSLKFFLPKGMRKCICTYLVPLYLQRIISYFVEIGVGQGWKHLETKLVSSVGSFLKEKEFLIKRREGLESKGPPVSLFMILFYLEC